MKTVCLYAEKPLSEINRIYLDFHSRTSVALTRILCEKYWKIQPEFVPASAGYESNIGGDAAGLIIGDRTIGQERRFAHTYDLGEAWTDWTGLPFVYAAWISVKPLHPEFIERFNTALQTGLDHIPELTKILPTMSGFDVEKYFRENISYELDEAKWQALNRFLGLVAGENGYRLYRSAMTALKV